MIRNLSYMSFICSSEPNGSDGANKQKHAYYRMFCLLNCSLCSVFLFCYTVLCLYVCMHLMETVNTELSSPDSGWREMMGFMSTLAVSPLFTAIVLFTSSTVTVAFNNRLGLVKFLYASSRKCLKPNLISYNSLFLSRFRQEPLHQRVCRNKTGKWPRVSSILKAEGKCFYFAPILCMLYWFILPIILCAK